METLVLKQEIKDRILLDIELRKDVSKALDRSFFTIPEILKRNDVGLTSVNVLAVIRQHTGLKKDSDIMDKVTKVTKAEAI